MANKQKKSSTINEACERWGYNFNGCRCLHLFMYGDNAESFKNGAGEK